MNCLICNNKLVTLHTFDKFPVYMGACESKGEDLLYSPLSFCCCESCFHLQTSPRISPEILYKYNHNVDLVGLTWTQHFDFFSRFLINNGLKGSVLEIGDPAAKVAKKCCSLVNNWDIIEPNPKLDDFDNVKFIRNFFNQHSKIYDCIVHSHLFEHQQNPVDFFIQCNKSLKTGSRMFMSVPDMKYFIYNFEIPTLCLHFEHCFYLDQNIINILAKLTNFKIVNYYYYNNHSIFFAFEKVDQVDYFVSNGFDIDYNKNIVLDFEEQMSKFKNNIKNIEQKIKDYKGETYIYSCHVNSQLLLSCLNNVKFSAVLDRAPSKIGKIMYGSNLEVYSPEKITDKDNVMVITSHTGIYRKEIEKNLLLINPGVTLI